MTGYRVYIETEEYGRVVVPLCEDCLPDDADIKGHISDDRHYGEGGAEQVSCRKCNQII